jgi:AcrR family transcriptional regulator
VNTVANVRLPPSLRRSRTRRVRLALEERRAQLIRLGQELLNQHGYDALGVDEIARRASISTGLLYHYFPSKSDYHAAVVEAEAAELLASTNPPSDLETLERLAIALDGYLRYARNHAKLFSAARQSSRNPDSKVANIILDTRQTLLMRMQAALPGRTARMRSATQGFLGFVERAVIDWLEHQDLTRDELRGLLLTMAEEAVRAGGARRDDAQREPS